MGTQMSAEALKFASGFLLMCAGYYIKSVIDRKEKDRVIDLTFVEQKAALEQSKIQIEGKFNVHDTILNQHDRRITDLEVRKR